MLGPDRVGVIDAIKGALLDVKHRRWKYVVDEPLCAILTGDALTSTR